MQRRLNNILLVIITFTFLLKPVLPSVSAAMDSSDPINLIASSDHGVEFTVSVPWQSLQHEVVDVDGELYTSLDLPGWANSDQPGAPALPFTSQSIGAPFGAEITVEVIPGRSHNVELSAPVLPSATLLSQVDPFASGMDAVNIVHVIDPDPEIYTSSEVYPGQLAEITVDGRLRQQRLVGVGITPLQYDPVKNILIVYENVHIKIRFTGQREVMRGAANPESGVYEAFFQSNFLNYVDVQAWRESPQPAEWLQSDTASPQNQIGAGTLPWEPPNPGWRISIQEDGLYRLTYATLAAAGLPVETLNPQRLQMFYQGEEIAIQVTGEEDGTFDLTDAIIFYGQGIDNKYTADNVYWLTFGSDHGLRMDSRDGAPLEEPDPVPNGYITDLHLEENLEYLSLLPGSDAFERFLWQMVHTAIDPTWSLEFDLQDPLEVAGTLQIALFGAFQAPTINPDHHVVVSINGTQVGDVKWDGLTWAGSWGYVETEIPPGLLTAGTNTLSLFLPNDLGVGLDIIHVDWAKIYYSNTFTVPTGENQLAFSYATEGAWTFQISGFESNALFAYDVSDPAAPVEIDPSSLLVEPIGSDYTLSFRDELSARRDYVVTADSAIPDLPVSAIEQDTPSALGASTNRADYILIAPKAFWEQAERLAIYRTNQGLATILVDIQDIYDEFGFGIADVSAIQAFLAFALDHWAPPAPSYVLLFGDGHYDPKNHLKTSPPSIIPPFLAMADPWIGETAADNRYVTFSGPVPLPQMMLGRLPANSIAEAEIMVSKIEAYEQDPPVGEWSMQVLALAGAADSGGNFPVYADNLIRDALPSPYQAEKIYFGITHTDVEKAQEDLKNSFNQGKLIVNFIGHATSYLWSAQASSSKHFISTADIPGLTNQDKYPIILAMTCLEGYFIDPSKPAFGEAIVRVQNKGAIASWSPTGKGVSGGHVYLNRGFYDAVFKHGVNRLGQAVTSGLSRLWFSGSSLYMLDAYILFGDPALLIKRNPAALDDFYTIAEDFKLEVSPEDGVLKNDSGFAQGNPLTAQLETDVANGNLIFASDGSFTYTPNKDWNGVEQFTYSAYDNQTFIGTATVTITVVAINDPPVAYPQTIETPMETSVEIVLTGSDVDGDPLTYSITKQPEHGDLYQNPPPGSGPRQGQALEPPLTYAPHPGYFGSDSFEYVVNDGKVNSAPTTISITIIGDSGTNLIFLPLIMH
ncbi:MAG: C25 family cysteine peptidase [Chloroflexota bacterium]|nr:C25 family cysteine peptidase [Chloroflexota bacterium]